MSLCSMGNTQNKGAVLFIHFFFLPLHLHLPFEAFAKYAQHGALADYCVGVTLMLLDRHLFGRSG